MSIAPRLQIVLLLFCSCKAQYPSEINQEGDGTTNLNYYEKINLIATKAKEYPEQVKFTRDFVRLTEGFVGLCDSLKAEVVSVGYHDPHAYFSTNKNNERFYSELMMIHSLGMAKIQDVEHRELINTAFKRITTANGKAEVIDTLFGKKSAIECMAELTQLQTDCLTIADFVLDDIIAGFQKK
jgi:hypothetical protein